MPFAVITGASSGLGKTFAQRLAREGYDLLLVARRRERLEALASELTSAHRIRAEAFEADLSTDDGVTALEGRLVSAPELSLLVNNAGFGIAGRFFDTPVEGHERMHRLHIMAVLRLTHAALRRMTPVSKGAVINVSSVAGFLSSPGSVSYAATKNWMNNFTEGLWLDLRTRGSGVRVQALCPGFAYTEFHDVMPMDRSRIPKGWWTAAEDVVDASLQGLKSGKLFVIPGWRYKLIVRLALMVPRSLSRAVSVWFAKNRMRRV